MSAISICNARHVSKQRLTAVRDDANRIAAEQQLRHVVRVDGKRERVESSRNDASSMHDAINVVEHRIMIKEVHELECVGGNVNALLEADALVGADRRPQLHVLKDKSSFVRAVLE